MIQATATASDALDEAAGFSDVLESFRNPPATHAPVPFYWWAGERLDRGRIAWQLDQLHRGGIREVVISYPHGPDGRSSLGDPELFSPDWWDLFRWFLTACRERGMAAGFQDYTLVEPILRGIGERTPGMRGGRLVCEARHASGGDKVRIARAAGTHPVAVRAYPLRDGLPQVEDSRCLAERVTAEGLDWEAPAGDWWVAWVAVEAAAFDPLHPDSGRLAAAELYAPFERECPGEVGATLNLFFQDELDFGSRMPFWSEFLPAAFSKLKGYELLPWLPALWHDLGPRSEKVRMDYADVVVGRIEECYFEPVFRWHEERGTMFGHDNCGRGRIGEGRSFYGDYFRTMRWFSAPGCDDPKLHGARSFRGLKVNSSIATLYQRPRVWVEAFHSSGWGTTPAEVVAALYEDLAYGANVVNLHGLYYSTCGGWWEWAPPDFHFRQPYWRHAAGLNGCLTRLCWLLSQGVHRCDVALVYPVAALHAEAEDSGAAGTVAHMGNDAIGDAPAVGPEDAAFGIGRHLFDRGCDFDFVDDLSLARAAASDGELRAGPGRYRVMILPAMRAVAYATLEKARDFVRLGGLVVAYGNLPRASERAGRGDPQLDALVMEIFGTLDESTDHRHGHPGGGLAGFVRRDYRQVLELVDQHIERDFRSTAPVQVLHRQLADLDVWFLFNPADEPLAVEAEFRATGRASWWDAWTGEIRPAAEGPRQRFELRAKEAKLLVFAKQPDLTPPPACEARPQGTTLALDGPWDFQVVPTLDNRFHDFSFLAGPSILGPEARRFLCAEEHEGGLTDWSETTYSFGPRLEVAGPFPPGAEVVATEWRPYEISTRWGIERDPFLTHWLTGPHGLKGAVPDDYLDFHADQPGSFWVVRATVFAPAAGDYPLIAGSRASYRVWINGVESLVQEEALPPGIHAPWGIPHHDSPRRETRVPLRQGANELRIQLVQPEGQRTRAHVAFAPLAEAGGEPALRCFADPTAPRACLPAAATRRALHFRMPTPPGAAAMTFACRGPARVWIDGGEALSELREITPDGIHRYRCAFPHPCERSAEATLRVEASLESRGGDALPEPVAFECGKGAIELGDWCGQGLATYSGAGTYTRRFEAPHARCNARLDLGALSATAEVRLNGHSVATLIAPPWTCDLSPFVVAGTNELSVTVANTLANHYSVGIPSPYAFPHQTRSGLFGPVTLELD